MLPTAPIAHAATTWHVTSTADAAPVPAHCQGPACTLRDAIAAAASGDTIDFQITFPATITLNQGQLGFNTDLTINGPTTTTLAVSANNASRVFSIGGKTTINNLTIRDGNEPAGDGGAIAIGSVTVLTLTSTSVISNVAQIAGGIWNNGGALTLISSTVSQNLATTNAGGGVYNNGPTSSLNMTGSTVSGNTALSAEGGGIVSGGPVTITGGSIISNTAGTVACTTCTGGGIYKVGSSNLTLTNVNVSNNKILGTSASAAGAGINNSGGSLIINGGVISNNVVSYLTSNGGGIFHAGPGSATISGTLIVSNTAGFGGGIGNGNSVAMTVMNATIISNTARFGGGISNLPSGLLTVSGTWIQANIATVYGGGITSDGPLTITNSTVSLNQTTGSPGGGGIYTDSPMTITNSTISSNQSSSDGGGIYANSSFVVLRHVTLANNSAGGVGGGISNLNVFTATNSIIAGNPSPSSSPDCNGTIGSGGYNLLSNNIGCTFTAAGTDQVGTNAIPINPKLSALGSWGGTTQTHGLISGSPALNKIPNATNGCGTTYTTDQRGFARPQNSLCDIGAFEGVLNGLYLPLIFR